MQQRAVKLAEERRALDAQEAAVLETRHFAENCDLLRTKQVQSPLRAAMPPTSRHRQGYAAGQHEHAGSGKLLLAQDCAACSSCSPATLHPSKLAMPALGHSTSPTPGSVAAALHSWPSEHKEPVSLAPLMQGVGACAARIQRTGLLTVAAACAGAADRPDSAAGAHCAGR